MKRALRLAAYRRLLAAYALNEIAYIIGALALTVLIYRRTGSAAGATAYFLCAQVGPSFVTPALVPRIDRFAPRVTLPALYVVETGLFVALALLADSFSLVPVLALTLLDGVLALSARTIARTASVTVLEPAGLLREGNALMNAAFSACFLAAPAIGGAAVAAAGAQATLVGVAAGFGCVGAVLLSGRDLPGAARRGGERRRLTGALRRIREHPALLRLLVLQSTAVVFFTISVPVEIVFVHRSLHDSVSAYGVLLAVWGGGATVGSAVYARIRGLPSRLLVCGATALLGVGYLGLAVAPDLAFALLAAFVGGAGNGVEAVAARTALQEEVEAEWLMVVTAINEAANQAAPGLGIIIGGALAVLASARVALAVAGLGAFAVAGLSWPLLRALRVSAAVVEPASGPSCGIPAGSSPP